MRREDFFASAAPLTPYVAVDVPGGGRLVLSTADAGLSRRLFAEPGAAAGRLRAALDAAGGAAARPVFVVGGAGLGGAPVAALTGLGFERALACEAAPRALALLRVNVVANGLGGRLRVVAVLASGADGHARLAVEDSDWESQRVTTLKAAVAAGLPRPPRVACAPLDALVASVGIDPADVGVLRLRSAEQAAVALPGARAIAAAGAVIVVESAPGRQARLRRALAQLGARVVVVGDMLVGVPPRA